jgi:hypothetical protein
MGKQEENLEINTETINEIYNIKTLKYLYIKFLLELLEIEYTITFLPTLQSTKTSRNLNINLLS